MKILQDLAKDLVMILQDPSRSLERSLKILARKFKILADPGGSLKILTRIFKDLDEDPHKDPHEDP